MLIEVSKQNLKLAQVPVCIFTTFNKIAEEFPVIRNSEIKERAFHSRQKTVTVCVCVCVCPVLMFVCACLDCSLYNKRRILGFFVFMKRFQVVL